MSYYLYAIQYTHGIKIGGTNDLTDRLNSHKSSGASLNVIHTVPVNDKQCELSLKKIMKNLNLIVTDVPNNDSTTEVYNLTSLHAITLMNILSTDGQITEQIVKTILYGETKTVTHMTYCEIHDKFGSSIQKPVFQRDINNEHVNALKEYIELNYYKPHFYLPPIVFVVDGGFTLDGTKSDSIVIDGLHRCSAIRLIKKNHPCMNMKIPVYIYQNINTTEQIQLFRDINKSRPVPQLFLVDQYFEKLHKNLLKLFIKYFSPSVTAVDNKFIKNKVNYVFQDELFSFLNNETINVLIDNGIITDISDKAIFQFIRQINTDLCCVLTHLLEIDKLREFNETNTNIDKVLEYIKCMNKAKTCISRKNFILFIDTVNKNTIVHGKSSSKLRKYEPYLLGLIYKIDLYTAHVFINTSDERFVVWE